MLKHEFRILKISWGIAIDIDTRFTKKERGKTTTNHLVSVEREIEVDFSGLKNITDIQKEFLVKGLQWVEEYLDVSTIIKIHKLGYNLTDYQNEGLFYAIAEWASLAFNFQLPAYEVAFDKKENKYVFRPE